MKPRFRPRKPSRPTAYAANEVKIHGVNACRALFANRPDDIVKVYLTRDRMREFTGLIKWCVERRKAYKIAEESELERLAESVHHEGICVIAKEAPPISFEAALKEFGAGAGPRAAFYLDGVGNPHNVGNILRTCAHFGMPFVFAHGEVAAGLPPSARRVSEGGAESVRVVAAPAATEAFRKLRALGFAIEGTSGRAAQNLFATELRPRSVIVLGAESTGMNAMTEKLCDRNLAIPGTGRVESLNVASAAAILAAEHFRRFLRS